MRTHSERNAGQKSDVRSHSSNNNEDVSTLATSTGTPGRLASVFEKLILDNDIPFDRNAAWESAISALLAEHPEAEIEQVMRYCQDSTFWRDKVRSPAKLAQHYDELRYQSRRGQQASAPAKLTGDQIRERVGRYRTNIAGGMVYGEPFLGAEEVEELCRNYESKLRGQR